MRVIHEKSEKKWKLIDPPLCLRQENLKGDPPTTDWLQLSELLQNAFSI